MLRPRGTRRQVLAVLALLALLATAVAATVAYAVGTTGVWAVAVGLGVLTLLLGSAWSASTPASVTVQGGRMEVLSRHGRHVFDLASPYTPIEVVGRPGSRSWKVLFKRRNMSPFVVDASMVDPHEFMRVLRFFRPEESGRKR